MPQELTLNWPDTLSLTTLAINLFIGVALAVVLQWHYKKYGSSLSNRGELALVFPLILLTTILIISIVKSSLALSLGLVGALSIVRFRTPIKEPEELAYLFIAIAMGLGLGANQTPATVFAGLFILISMAMLKHTQRDTTKKNLYLSIDCKPQGGNTSDTFLEDLNEIISRHTSGSDLRRFDAREGSLEAIYHVDIQNTSLLNSMIVELRDTFPGLGVTFLDQNQMPSI